MLGITSVITGVFWLLSSLLCPETYAPVILQQRAKRLTRVTGRVYLSKLDVGAVKAAKFVTALCRPWILLFTEPIVLISSVYVAVIYGTLYLCFDAFPIVFQVGRAWGPGLGGLAFIGIAVGVIVGTGFLILDNQRYSEQAKRAILPPERRLQASIIGSIFVPLGLFWFAWTNGREVHWAVPIAGSGFFSCGLIMVFLGLLNYLIDSCKLIYGFT